MRIFNLYYPPRTLLLLGGELTVICASFLLATLIRFGQDSYLVLGYEYGLYKILAVTGFALFFGYSFDLYDLQRLQSRGEFIFRMLAAVGALSLFTAAISYLFPQVDPGNGVLLTGLCILAVALIGWRSAYGWLIGRPYLRERVYVLGAGERANWLVENLRINKYLGLDVVGWAGANNNVSPTREELANMLLSLKDSRAVDRVIVAMSDRRSTMPIRELLELRMANIKVENAADLLEKVSGKIEVDGLNPSWLVFSEGFGLSSAFLLAQRLISFVVAFVCLVLVLPITPLIALAIKLTSPGSILYRQKRVGRSGVMFNCYKFRTMSIDAEADKGPTWASDDDPRITRVGHWLRITRLDEIPQLWNVLRGDMSFCGPRPERPEFVDWLTTEIPYYHLRHVIRPGITGWAQIRYKYGNSVEDAKEKLRYDLYYIKNISLGFDLMIIFETLKVVALGRGAR